MNNTVLIELSQLLVGDLIVVENSVWEVTGIEPIAYGSHRSPFARMVDLRMAGNEEHLSSIILDPMPDFGGPRMGPPDPPPLRLRIFKSTTKVPIPPEKP